VYVQGVEKVSLAFSMMREHSIRGARIALSEMLHRVEHQERNLLSLGWHPPGTKTGSVSPQPPWRISGHLSRSVGVEEPHLGVGWRGVSWKGWVGASAVYARIHELGGWTGRNHATYLPPRPHLRPAWAIVAPQMTPTFYHEMTKATRPPRI
jgi:hypothetical protein